MTHDQIEISFDGMKTSPRLDFERLFELLHDPCLVLNPELRIIAVNDAYLHATMTKRVDI